MVSLVSLHALVNIKVHVQLADEIIKHYKITSTVSWNIIPVFFLNLFRRIPLDKVPTETDEMCARWLQNHFKEKVRLFIMQDPDKFRSSISLTCVITDVKF